MDYFHRLASNYKKRIYFELAIVHKPDPLLADRAITKEIIQAENLVHQEIFGAIFQVKKRIFYL